METGDGRVVMGIWKKESSGRERFYGVAAAIRMGVILILLVLGSGLVLALRLRFEPFRHTIAFIPQTAGTELWESSHVGAQAGGLRTGYRIYWNAPTRDDDVLRQIELIETAIHNRDAGLIVAPIQYLALVSPLREALARHIPVAIVSTSLPIPPGDGLTYLLNDEQETGRMAARKIGSLLKGRGTIAILGVNPNIDAVMERLRSFEATISTEFPGISIVERRAASPSSAESGEFAQDVLLEHPDLSAFFGLNSTATEGALAVLRPLHKSPRVLLVGCDQEIDLMEGIRKGDVDAIIVQNSYAMGYQAVEAIAADRSHSPAQHHVLISPVLVTQANIDDPDVQKLLSVDWRPGQ
jgi:ribose transport system substrate-binding protein